MERTAGDQAGEYTIALLPPGAILQLDTQTNTTAERRASFVHVRQFQPIAGAAAFGVIRVAPVRVSCNSVCVWIPTKAGCGQGSDLDILRSQ